MREILGLLHKTNSITNQWGAMVLYSLLVYIGYDSFFLHTESNTAIVLFLICTILICINELFGQNNQPFQNISSTVWASLFTASSFIGIAYFFAYRTDLPSFWMTVSVFGLIWVNDSGAYLVGRLIGRTKLFERLSPNKTWEGSIGGLMSGLGFGIGMSFIEGMPPMAAMIGFSLVCIIFGSLGDLFQSRLKRAANVKDSGKFLPGHGGFFDRFDAMMMAVPSAICYFELVLPKK